LKTWQGIALGAVGTIVVIIAILAIWNFFPRAPSIEPASVDRMAYPLPDKPSIAVLPFTNMSGDSEQEYIGDGLSENIISALSVSSQLFVIARNTTFTYKGKAVDVKQVAEDLGVQYVLEGSILKSGERLRVTALLIDALSGHHLWSEVYDREMKELFELLDEITKKILVSLQVELTSFGEDARVLAKSTHNLEAWKHFIKGKELFEHFTNEDNEKAREHFETALELDPQYVSAMSHLGFAHIMDSINGWSDSPSASSNRALELAQKALKLDDQDPLAHGLTGFIFVFQREHEKAITEGTRAITLDPNFTLGHGILGLILTYSGEFDEAITILKKGYRLNPNLDPVFLRYLAESYSFLERYEEALEVCEEMDEHVLNGRFGGYKWFPSLFSSWIFQELGREKESHNYMEEALKREPDLSLERYKRLTPHKNPAYLQKELDAFRKAGMPERAPGAVQEKPSIVVLPFVNISGDPEQEYFSDGMTEEIINALANVEGLKVISRTSSFFFKGKDVDLRTIGEKLNVDHVIEGSVRKAGNKLKIRAELVKVADDTHLWSNTFNRELKDVFAIQEEISNAIVDSLKVRLLGNEKELLVKSYTENTDAYEAYIKGRYYYLNFMEGSMEKALQYYEQAIDLDPGYALAYSAIAEWYWNLPYTGQKNVSRDEVYTYAKEAINTALEIDNELAEAHSNLGTIKWLYEWDWKGAEEAFEQGIRLNPGLSKAHYDYAFFLSNTGNPDKAILQARTAVELDPLYGISHHCLGASLYFAGQFDQALGESRQAYEMMPSYLGTLPILINIYNIKGMFKEAMDVVNKGLEVFQGHPMALRFKGFLHTQKGEEDKTREVLDELLERSKKEYVTPFAIALLYADLGEVEKAMEYLETGYEKRDIFFLFFRIDYHNDDRFNAFFKKIGLLG
jgi:TolB-like protein/Tfp pilus assembly protein PilF